MKNKSIVFACLAAIGLISCEDVIDLDIPNQNALLVIQGEITDKESPHYVDIYLTNPYLGSDSYSLITDAEVVLFENESVVDTFNIQPTGRYKSNYQGSLNSFYTILVTMNDGSTYESIPEKISRVNPIDSIYAEFEPETPFTDAGYTVYFDTYEPAGRGDFYRWKTYFNNQLVNDPFFIRVSDDEFVDGNEINEFQVNFEPLPAGDTVRIEQMSISRGNFEYWSLILTQTAQVGSNFDPPPAPIRGNIVSISNPDETVLGYFSASAVVEAEIILN